MLGNFLKGSILIALFCLPPTPVLASMGQACSYFKKDQCQSRPDFLKLIEARSLECQANLLRPECQNIALEDRRTCTAEALCQGSSTRDFAKGCPAGILEFVQDSLSFLLVTVPKAIACTMLPVCDTGADRADSAQKALLEEQSLNGFQDAFCAAGNCASLTVQCSSYYRSCTRGVYSATTPGPESSITLNSCEPNFQEELAQQKLLADRNFASLFRRSREAALRDSAVQNSFLDVQRQCMEVSRKFHELKPNLYQEAYAQIQAEVTALWNSFSCYNGEKQAEQFCKAAAGSLTLGSLVKKAVARATTKALGVRSPASTGRFPSGVSCLEGRCPDGLTLDPNQARHIYHRHVRPDLESDARRFVNEINLDAGMGLSSGSKSQVLRRLENDFYKTNNGGSLPFFPAGVTPEEVLQSFSARTAKEIPTTSTRGARTFLVEHRGATYEIWTCRDPVCINSTGQMVSRDGILTMTPRCGRGVQRLRSANDVYKAIRESTISSPMTVGQMFRSSDCAD